MPKDAGHVHQREEMDPLALLEQAPEQDAAASDGSIAELEKEREDKVSVISDASGPVDVETLKNDIKQLEWALAASMAELEAMKITPAEHTVADSQPADSEALTSAHAEIARLAAELSELEESKDLAMKESEEQNEEKLRSIVDAHEELEKSLREELDVARREKERITQALGTSDERFASLVDEKSRADSFARELQIKLEAIAAEKESLEQELHAREAELLSKLEIAQDASEAHMTLIT